MDFNFTGSSRPKRTINLGRQPGPKSVADVAAQVRAQREDRRMHKVRVAAATRIQAAYRQYTTCKALRQQCAQEFDHILNTSVSPTADAWIHLTRLLVFSQGRNVSCAEARRLALWAEEFLSASTWPKPALSSWVSLLAMVLECMLRCMQHAQALEASYTRAMLTFMLGLLCKEHENVDLAKQMTSFLLSHGMHSSLRNYLVALPKDAISEQADCVSLMLRPLALFDEPTTEFVQAGAADASSYAPRAMFLRTFTSEILTIPHLLHHMPIPSVSALSSAFPMSEFMHHVQSLGAYYDVTSGDSALANNPIHCPYLLANVIILTAVRVKAMQNGSEISQYLMMLATLQNALPKSVFADEDASIDQKTKNELLTLVSFAHIRSVLAASMRSPHNTRPALCAFLVATLYTWPASARDSVLTAMLYGYDKDGVTRSVYMGILARELWRGWVRSCSLVRCVATKLRGLAANASNVRAVVTDPTYASDWPLFLILCIEYSRCLMILGDDEFYPSSAIDTHVPSRNPLTLDELDTLSGLLRNITFAMYWNSVDMPPEHAHVPGTRVQLAQVRELCTRLLQQLHTRDSRRSFVREGHWHMLGQNDLGSFIHAVVLEERELASAISHDEDATNARATISALSQRTRAFMTPRLEVLSYIPFVIPFDVRVEIFRQFVRNDAERLGISRDIFSPTRRHRATIRRGHIAEDGMAKLNGLGPSLKEPLEIVFIDQWGMPEAGIDGSGLFKEFLVSIIREVFDTDRGLWCANERQELYPNPHSYAHGEEQLTWYTFLGRILGKALYEGILVDVKFADFFLTKWLGPKGYIDDLASLESLDSDLYRGLIALKNYTGNVENDFALNFTVTDEEFGVRMNRELIPGGNDVPVTRENRLSYIYCMTRYRLSTQIEDQCNAFFQGLSEMIDPRWLRLFNREELRVLVSGAESPIDVDDLRRNTVYGGYHEKDMAVQYFWEALSHFDQSSLKVFLRFVTSSPNPPLLGFSELNPKFAIRHAGDDVTRLPTASTCVNLLKLPAYESVAQCADKLRYAIYAGAGFDLS